MNWYTIERMKYGDIHESVPVVVEERGESLLELIEV